MSAWEEQPPEDYETVWTPFDRIFHFKPSTTEWPGFREPRESVTYHIGHVYGDPEHYASLTLDLCHKLIAALRGCIAVGEFLNVLEWQHSSYRFWPHKTFDFTSEDDWPVPALPNGDYYIFLNQELSLGVLGHPWEQTMCIFGESLLGALEQDQPILFDRPIRVGGRVV